MKTINLKTIRIDGGTQSRVALNESVVAEYIECLPALPPIVIFFDGSDHWLADGFHRYHAYLKAGKASIPADVHTGTRRDAKLYSAGANWSHGLRRTNDDKRRTVAMLLEDAEWAEWSDRKIADACGVSVSFVGAIRRPAVAEKQRAHREERQASKYPTEPKGCSATTPQNTAKSTPKVAPWDVPATDVAIELEDTQKAVSILSEENERLTDRLAVEAMNASEEEKTLAKETIETLRAKVKTLTAELDAVKASRDSFMRECNELKKQCAAQRRQLDKLKAVA